MKQTTEQEFRVKYDAAHQNAEKYVRKLASENRLKLNCPHETLLKRYLESDIEKAIVGISNKLYRDFFCEQIDDTKEVELYGSEECALCGKDILYSFKAGLITPIDAECYHPEPFSVDIRVPSGKVIMTDWFERGKELLGHLDYDKEHRYQSINSIKGCVDRSLRFAKENIMHFFVGNTSPRVYLKDGIIYIGNDGYGDDGEEESLVPGGIELGSVTTDLWWVTAFDYEVIHKLAVRVFGEDQAEMMMQEAFSETSGVVIANVKPGVYRCTHYYELVPQEGRAPHLFNRIEWISE